MPENTQPMLVLDQPVYWMETVLLGYYSYYPENNMWYWESAITGMSWSANDTNESDIAQHLYEIWYMNTETTF